MQNFKQSGKSNMRNSQHSHKSTQALNQIKLKGNQPKKDNMMSERVKIMLEPEAEQINHSRISSYHEMQLNQKNEFSRQAPRIENILKISNQHKKRQVAVSQLSQSTNPTYLPEAKGATEKINENVNYETGERKLKNANFK